MSMVAYTVRYSTLSSISSLHASLQALFWKAALLQWISTSKEGIIFACSQAKSALLSLLEIL